MNVEGHLVDLKYPKVMGVLNITPDSFYDGGSYSSHPQALKRIEKMVDEGADIIDVGGYSSRPGATDISEEEEEQRILPVIADITKEFPNTIISVDTFRSSVAEKALDKGAAMVNDISGGNLDVNMYDLIGRTKVPYIMMHIKGTPQTMRTESAYENVLLEVIDDLQNKINKLRQIGVSDVIVDPGFGFAKTVGQNYEILKNLEYFKVLNLPILVGLSRKSMIYKTLEVTPEKALNGSTVLNTIALTKGADILRVHDVKEAKEAVKLYSMVAR